ncbi:serine/threonine-protein phosphatase [Streptomyces samsunensis]|nr:serine/threonine-protein phosphatase [Streptomyces samsunensis]
MRLRYDPARSIRPQWSSPLLLVVPVGLIVAITLVDINTPATIPFGPFLVAAPAIAASFAGPRETAMIGALAVAAQVLLSHVQGGVMTSPHQAQLGALVVISALVTVLRYATDRHLRRLSLVRSVAVAAQEVLLRPLPGRVGPLCIASVYHAAQEEAQIGGDLYAAVRVEGATRLVIGDVRGKGLSAVGDASVLIGAFRGSAYCNLSLPGVAAHLGNAVYWNWIHSGEDSQETWESFVTALVLDVYDESCVAGMVNCGHPPPLLVHGTEITTLEATDPAPPLGLDMVSECDFTAGMFYFEDGDLLLLYTDGVTEARDSTGTFYPLPARLAAWKGSTAQSLVRYLQADLLQHVGGRINDDVAIVAITRAATIPGVQQRRTAR